jgi:hypothetical protein
VFAPIPTARIRMTIAEKTGGAEEAADRVAELCGHENPCVYDDTTQRGLGQYANHMYAKLK